MKKIETLKEIKEKDLAAQPDKRQADLEQAKQIALQAANALAEVKGKDIIILDFAGKSSFTDYFVIATGDSPVHMQALANRVRNSISKAIAIDHTEGRESKNWVLLDYHTVIIHIFSRKAREYYAIDQLWGDAQVVSWSDELGSTYEDEKKENGTWH